ncbi:MAG: RNA polymerase sporulation sigma factor SigG [Clostridiales bacterium]
MQYRKVEICGVDTSKLPVLSNKVMTGLFKEMQSGDENAREEIIGGNLRLVLSIIQRFTNRGENLDDLFQVGCIGLMKATDNFDLSQNVHFSTYAVPMIIGEIRRYLRDNKSLRVSRSLRDIAYKALQAKERLLIENGKEPTIEQIAAAIEVPRETITYALDAIQDPISIYEPIYHDGGDPLLVMDQIGDDKNNDKLWTEHLAIGEAMKKISPREKKIIDLRFFQGRTQMEVATEIGISQAQVSRLEKNALTNLRKHI